MAKQNRPTKKEMEDYKKFLTECGKYFVLTPEDLSNLYDLSYMITWQDYERIFKPNKMHNWFKNFFDRLEEVCLAEKKDYSKVIMKQIKQSEDLRTKK
jgi:hypothetical protein